MSYVSYILEYYAVVSAMPCSTPYQSYGSTNIITNIIIYICIKNIINIVLNNIYNIIIININIFNNNKYYYYYY